MKKKLLFFIFKKLFLESQQPAETAHTLVVSKKTHYISTARRDSVLSGCLILDIFLSIIS
jgi:hypothetical protein